MTERVEKVFRCPKDGRTVASLIVDEDARRWLDIVGGRDGHSVSLRKEMWEATIEWRKGRELTVRDLGEEFYRQGLARLTKPEISQDVPPERRPIPQDLDIGALALGMEPIPIPAPCPRCHRPVRLVVRYIDEDGPVFRETSSGPVRRLVDGTYTVVTL